MKNLEINNVGLYCRTAQANKNDIENQEKALKEYCNQNGLKVVEVYADNGYSGLNFDRPAFQKMLKDIEDKKINIVITTDLARIGRDTKEAMSYTNEYFVSKNVKYINLN